LQKALVRGDFVEYKPGICDTDDNNGQDELKMRSFRLLTNF